MCRMKYISFMELCWHLCPKYSQSSVNSTTPIVNLLPGDFTWNSPQVIATLHSRLIGLQAHSMADITQVGRYILISNWSFIQQLHKGKYTDMHKGTHGVFVFPSTIVCKPFNCSVTFNNGQLLLRDTTFLSISFPSTHLNATTIGNAKEMGPLWWYGSPTFYTLLEWCNYIFCVASA